MSEDKFNLSRRKALAALGTIGVASAGAGLGTSAYFSDQETFENNQLTAGTLDMKVAATEYYSDWSPDEAEYAGMASDEASTDIRLPAGADQTDARDIALDLDDDYDGDAADVYAAFFDAISTDADGTPYNRVNGGVSAAAEGLCGTESDADGPMIVDIGDVKPGDFGGAQFAFELCDNPGYVWLTGGLEDASENGITEPEGDDPDEAEGVVELLDEIQVAYGVGPINGDTSAFEDTDAGFQPTNQQSLREFLEMVDSGTGIPLEGDTPAEQGGGTGRDCFAGSPEQGSAVHQVSVVWWLPINHGNQVQSDSVTFDLGFYTEQCRHNDGEGMPPEDVTIQSDATGGVRETDNWITATISPGSTTRISVDLDGAVYGDEADEWPNNPTSYVMEAVVDHDFDGLAGSDSNGYPDDFRIGYGGADSATRNAAGYSSAGGYIKRRQQDGSFVTVAEEDLAGFSATESGDQLSYTFEIDWTSDLSSTGSDVGVPSEMIVSEVFGSDGGEGVAATPNSSNDGRGDVDNVTESSGTIQL
jgi:predicted ribosomally synthesized peptide with SipW-like signal peptide